MNEVKLLNIGGIDQNVKDQYARDIIAPSENGLDSTSNLPVASRPYKTGEFLIGQDRLYYEAIADIEIGDTLVVNVNIKATTVSNELVSLRNKSADAAIECIAPMEKTGLSSAEYKVGEYLYWDYGLNAGLYKAKTGINIGDAFVVDTNIEVAPNVESQIQTLTNQVDDMNNILGAKNLCQHNLVGQTDAGITLTVYPDESFAIVGTAQATSAPYVHFDLFVDSPCNSNTMIAAGKKYIISKALSDSCYFNFRYLDSSHQVLANVDVKDNDVEVTIPTEARYISMYLIIKNGTTVNNRLYPMIRPASIKDDTYVPYALSNLALTNSLSFGDLPLFRAGRVDSINADYVDFVKKDQSFNRIVFYEGSNNTVFQHWDANNNLLSQYDNYGVTGTALTVAGSPFPNVGYARAGRVVSVATYYDITTNWTGWSGVALTGFPKPLIDDYNLSYALYNGVLYDMIYKIATDGNLYIYSGLPIGATIRTILKATYITNDQ